MDEKHVPETIYEDDENAVYGRPTHSKSETPNRKRTPLGLRNRRMRPQTSPSSSSPRSIRDYRLTTALPTPSPRCVSNPFDQGGIVMSPSALSVNSNIGTPSSVKSGGWTLEQRSALFPAQIDDELVTTQYESPITEETIEKNKSDCQQWLDQADLTSPWNSTVPKSKQKNRSRISSKSFTSRGTSDACTQTNTSLPPDFNLFEFLEKHGVAIQAFNSRENSLSGSANSSLRRKLFDCGQYSDSDSEGDVDFNPINSPKYENHQSPKPTREYPDPVTPSSEQFSSSPIKISPSIASTSSPGALSCCGGATNFASPFQDESPYRSPFRSPFGDPNISLSPILKSKLFAETENVPEEGNLNRDAVRNLNFETTSNFDSDLDETAHDTHVKHKNQSKLVSSSLENSLDVSMRSDSWDVSAIPGVGFKSDHTSHKNAESTHIQPNSVSCFSNSKSIEREIDNLDVYMGSYSQESRGFSFCEPDEPAIEDSNETQTDSGISSAPNSRTGSALHCEKPKQVIPLPTFSPDVIHEDNF